MYILGVSGGPRGSHDAGVCVLDTISGEVKHIFLEERHSRVKMSFCQFPHRALIDLFTKTSIKPDAIDIVAHPGETYDDMKIRWPSYLECNFGIKPKKYMPINHQLAHCASSYFYSNFDEALCVSLDGVGDGISGSIYKARGPKLERLEVLSLDQSVGFFWNIVCQQIGYEVMEEAYKTMGLAAYGEPKFNLDFALKIESRRPKLNMEMFNFSDFKFLNPAFVERQYSDKFSENLGFPPRKILDQVRQIDKDLAASAQLHVEKIIFEFLDCILEEYPSNQLCLSGGVFLNSKMSGLLNEKLPVNKIFVTPGPGDEGISLGCVLTAYSTIYDKRPLPIISPFMGMEYSDESIKKQLEFSGLVFKEWGDYKEIAKLLQLDNVIAIHQGRSEFGPRALGARSIIASPKSALMKDRINKKIKFREEYRPFAPVIRDIDFDEYFNRGNGDYSYMSFTIKAKTKAVLEAPAAVHFDGTSRVQEAKSEVHTFFYKLLTELKLIGEVPILINTSFNLKGEPIVESPSDAIRTFIASGLDYLVLGKYLISKYK